MIPRSALEQEREQDRIATTVTRSVRQIWRRMLGRNWANAWRDDVGPSIQQVVLAGQEAAASSADSYIAAVLAETGINPDVPTSFNIDSLIGVAGDGRPVESLTYGGVIHAAKFQYSPEVQDLPDQAAALRALESASDWMDQIVAGILADTARAAESASTAQRTWVTGYVRMINPGACSRCVVLAGKYYRYNTGFQRHPKCMCRHIPASENLAGDMLTSPDRYFHSLSKSEQDRIFTNDGAEAIRMGADVSQVVNARRGMQTAQVYGRKTLVTTEATTARGLAGKSLGELGKVAGQRYRQSGVPRLMPESIIATADSPTAALRLLKRFGYVL